MKYKALFFDLDDTLWAFSQNAEETFREIYARFHFGRYFISFRDFYSLYQEKNKEMWAAYAKGEVDRITLNQERFKYPLERVGVYDTDLVCSYSAVFFERIAQHSRLMPGAKQTLEKLKVQFPLYIISNGFRELQFKKMDSAGIASFFKGVFLSDDIGYHKPHPAIFKKALDVAGVAPHEAIMIGDNWVADIKGAQESGMDQIYIGVQQENDLGIEPTHRIHRLDELPHLLLLD